MSRIYDLDVSPVKNPEFSWRLRGNDDQIGYRIILTDKNDKRVFDSHYIESELRRDIVLNFSTKVNEFYNWKLTVFFDNGENETKGGKGFYTPIESWDAHWVEPDRKRKPMTDKKFASEVNGKQSDPLERLDAPFYARKQFSLNEVPNKAFVYVSARGIYGLWINGKLVSDLFSPGYTSYPKRIEYQVYDIAEFLNKGKNVIGLIVADGWYTGKIEYIGVGQQYGKENSFILQLQMDDVNGNTQKLISDKSFKWATGSQRYADLYVGEYYDDNITPNNWLSNDYDDSEWKPLIEKDYPTDTLKLQTIPPVKVVRTIKPKVIRTPKNELVLDAGETIVGYTSFKDIHLNSQGKVSFEHSETLDKDGNFLQNILGQNKQQKDFFVASKEGKYSWSPQFTFHGFRYVKIEGTDDCDPNHYQINVIATPMMYTGELNTSDQRINQLQSNIVRSQVGNMISIPTDCPQRERTGWTGDMQVYAPTATYEMDVERFLRHWLEDMRNEQQEDGQVPQVIPCAESHDYMRPEGIDAVDTAGWSDAAVIVPWRLYQTYGNKEILKENYSMIKKYVKSVEKLAWKLPRDADQLTKRSRDNNHYLWNTDFQFGDWLMPGYPGTKSADATGKEVATLMYILISGITSKIAKVLDDDITEAYYEKLSNRIKDAFVEEYMNDDGTMTSDYQGVYVLAFATHTIPNILKSLAANRLRELIADNGDTLGTGFLSVAYLLPVLNEIGLQDVARKILFQDKCPSWLYEVKMGATTMWEAWDAYDSDGTPNEYSMNHFAFGCVGEYLFRSVLGIDHISDGYKKVLIKPNFNCGLSKVDGSFESIWGKIDVSWEIIGHDVNMKVQLPPNVSATVDINGKKFENIRFNDEFHEEISNKSLEFSMF